MKSGEIPGDRRTLQPAPWRIRALQLDLARHMETIRFIKEYAESAAGNGYNMLVLYLEGRVRTKTFPFRPEDKSYTLEQMSEVVAHAKRLGLEIMPVVSMLGHCEQFLACEELRHLSETRHGHARFGKPSGGGSVVCPSLRETVEFFSGYLTELAEVVTGDNFHAGMDEAWDLGFCELCRPRWERDGLGVLLSEHLRAIHGIVARLGKRMWMWDDMFELFPDRLADIPRDIVMCHWNYDEVIRAEGCQAHFVNRFRMDWLKVYERFGIDAVVCPCEGNLANVKAMTEYGRRHKVLGGLNTQWEVSPRLFPPARRTLVAFTGLLWDLAGFDPEAAWREALSRTLGEVSPQTSRAAWALLERPLRYPAPSLDAYRSGFPTPIEEDRRTTVALALDLIELALGRDAASAELRFIGWGARMELLHWELRALVPAVLDPRRTATDTVLLTKRAQAAVVSLDSLQSQWGSFTDTFRLNEMPQDAKLPARWFGCRTVLADLLGRLSRVPTHEDWLLILRLHLQDFYSAPYLKIQVFSDDCGRTLFEGSHKLDEIIGPVMGGSYDLQLAFSSATPPRKVRLEGGGYGGQGVAFLELRNPDIVLKPSALARVTGPVERAHALLRDDSSVTLLGNADILAQMHDPERFGAHGSVEVTVAGPDAGGD